MSGHPLFLTTAVEGVVRAGDMMLARVGDSFRIDKKSAIDLVTEVDLATPIRQAFGVEVVMANDAVAVALAITAAEPALAQGKSRDPECEVRSGTGFPPMGMALLLEPGAE